MNKIEPSNVEDLLIGMAAGSCLSEWPKDKTLDEILELIEKEDDSVIIWEPLENSRSRSDLIENIQNTYDFIKDQVRHVVQPLIKAIKEGDPQTIADIALNIESSLK